LRRPTTPCVVGGRGRTPGSRRRCGEYPQWGRRVTTVPSPIATLETALTRPHTRSPPRGAILDTLPRTHTHTHTHTMPAAPRRPGCNPYRVSECDLSHATSGLNRGQRSAGLINGSNQGAIGPVTPARWAGVQDGGLPLDWGLAPRLGACSSRR